MFSFLFDLFNLPKKMFDITLRFFKLGFTILIK